MITHTRAPASPSFPSTHWRAPRGIDNSETHGLRWRAYWFPTFRHVQSLDAETGSTTDRRRHFRPCGDFSYPKWTVNGTADLDSAFRIVHSRVDYKSYVQEDHLADYRTIDGIEVPWVRVTSVARRDREGRIVRGSLVVFNLGDVEVNPELGDQEFKLAAPANTRIRKLDDRGHSIERVVISKPIDDVSSEVDGLHPSTDGVGGRDADSAITAPLVAFACAGALAALLTIGLYTKKKAFRD